MRILYCNKYNFAFSGTETYLFSAMKMMQERGHETALFSMADPRGDPTPFDRYLVKHQDFKAPHRISSRVRLAMHAIYSVEARTKLRAMIRDFKPDIAHVRNIYHHLSPSILWELKAQGVPVIYHLNDFKLLCPCYNMVSASGKACERCKDGKFKNVILRHCYSGGVAASGALAAEAYVHRWLRTYERCVDLILAPSQFAKRKLVEGGWSSSTITVLPHFQTIPDTITAPDAFSDTILYFGRLSREKGIQDLLDAARTLPHLHFVIAGDGPERKSLEDLATSFGITNMTFTGHVAGPALDRLIAASQFTVFPSHAYETFGKSILESYAQARAVIASDLGSRRELIDENKTGLLYPSGNVDKLAASIEFLFKHPEVAREMGAEARRLVIEKYSPEQHFQALTSIYQDLRSRDGTRSPQVGVKEGLGIAFIGGRGVLGKYSGIESFYEEAGRRLVADGLRITAYCRNYFTPAGKAEHDGIQIVRLPTIRSKHLDTFIHTLISTLHACFSGVDIVHFHTLGPSLFSWLPRLFGKMTVVSVQGLDWQRRKWSWFARNVLKIGEWASARLPNRTVVVSCALREYYRAKYSKEVTYIPNGTDLRKKRSGGALKQFGLRSDHYVLFLGRFSPEKNCGMLIDAFEQTDTSMKLVLAGGSSHTDAYVADLRRHASQRVLFLDWLSGDALEEVLTNAALFVLPSDMEGLSLALLDAMGAGVCVLASDVPENCEALADAGFTFRRGDRQHLTAMLSTLLRNGDLRAEAGRKARERIRHVYLWDDVVQRLEELYFELNPESDVSVPKKERAQAA